MGKTADLINEIDINQFDKQELFHLAYFETVTNYYNWNWMREKLEDFEKYGIEDFAFVHFDIKDFKMVNEIYGHDAGDDLLRKVCRVLQDQDWAYYTSRCDSDNFAMMVQKLPDEVIREKLEKMFARMDRLDADMHYPIYFRCGVASIDNVSDFRATITDLAKIAQHFGMKANETEIHFYTDDMKRSQLRSKMLKADLDRAMEENELEVYYQPKFDPVTNALVGAEALIRWNYHHETILPPKDFVPYFEQEGTIERVDRFVLEQVCKKLNQWKQEGVELVPISVNMSRAQLYSPLLVKTVKDIVDKYDIDRKYIEFELTESMAYDDSQYMIEVMKHLRELGFMLSIDDFGTGYSSLSLLADMPLTTLKLDKSFVDEIGNKEKGKTNYIVRNILEMTKFLNINSIAEGVETEVQKNLLKEWGCNYIQGYFYSKPIPVALFEEMLKKKPVGACDEVAVAQ